MREILFNALCCPSCSAKLTKSLIVKIDRGAVIAELADVTLMLGQLCWMFGQEQVDTAVKVKLAKLDNLLSSEG